jgi:dimethylamine/trimethylamine dehydrogenase
VLEFGADHVALATGATWRRERFAEGRYVSVAAEGTDPDILTPDDIMDGRLPQGPVIVYDEDGYYMGGVIAERLRATGLEVTLCTPSEVVSEWAGKTSERWTVRTHLMKLGIGIELSKALIRFDGDRATLACTFTGTETSVEARSVVMVTQRRPNDALYNALLDSVDGDARKLPFTLRRIGDCEAPAIVAAATYAGHRYARELE